MGIVFIIIVVVFYFVFFYDNKSDVSKLKDALKETTTEELNFVHELITNELKNRDRLN